MREIIGTQKADISRINPGNKWKKPRYSSITLAEQYGNILNVNIVVSGCE